MMRFTTGNLLDAKAEALVNTVNTVGVMGKGIALMFRDKFPENYHLYREACEADRVRPGGIMTTKASDMYGPRWIVNFATKGHWRQPSRLEWIESGLRELRRFIESNDVKSIAIPPLGAGNGGLEWVDVRRMIERELGDLGGVEVIVYEPTAKYQNVAKRAGVETLTPARALIAEMIRRYEVLGIECTLLEAQKLAWFVKRMASQLALGDPLQLSFQANKYGPYADQLRHALNALDGSYLECDKRLGDAGPFDAIRFSNSKREKLLAYFSTPEAKPYRPALEAAAELIDGFESPLGMELLATVDWLLQEGVAPTVDAVRAALGHWNHGGEAARRKQRIFEPRLIELALRRLDANDVLQGRTAP